MSWNAVFVFVDNLYMLGPENVRKNIPMTEDMPMTNHAVKPRVRAALDEMVMAHKGCPVVIIRASDFYGAGVVLAATGEFILQKMANGQRPQVLFSADVPHALTYVPDIAVCVRN